VLPGWRVARPDVMQMLRSAGRSAHLGIGGLLRSGIVIAEVALAFVLLVGSGLMFRSFLELLHVDPGYDPHGLLTFLTVGDAKGFQQPQRRLAFLRELEDRLRAIPGIQNVGAATGLPLHAVGSTHGIQWRTEQIPEVPTHTVDLPTVLPGYFETLHTRILEGRAFTEADNASGRNLAVIDQSLAEKAFPSQSALGKRICVLYPESDVARSHRSGRAPTAANSRRSRAGADLYDGWFLGDRYIAALGAPHCRRSHKVRGRSTRRDCEVRPWTLGHYRNADDGHRY
jgi:hypothetical protein